MNIAKGFTHPLCPEGFGIPEYLSLNIAIMPLSVKESYQEDLSHTETFRIFVAEYEQNRLRCLRQHRLLQCGDGCVGSVIL